MSKTIRLAHGNGGRLMHELIERMRLKFSNSPLDELADAAEITVKSSRLAFSTDSYVVKPLFFPGGDIGKLAVCGTVNDISMKGARPLFLSLAFIVEEGLEFSVIDRIVGSVKMTAGSAGVKIVTGDIKVVERSAADKIFINTSGIGVIEDPRIKIGAKARIGDLIVINGTIAEHGIAVLDARQGFGFKPSIKSDCCCLNSVVAKCVAKTKAISVMRDLTRGGLATALNEIALSSDLGIEIDETRIPVKANVQKVCDVLGMDPIYIANEGKFAAFVKAADADAVRKVMGPSARIIGQVTGSHRSRVYMTTRIGAKRQIPMLESDQLPRIC